MKILFPISWIYPDQSGGPSNSIYWMAKSLEKNGEKVTIVATDKGLKGLLPVNKWINTDYGRVIYVKTLNYKYHLQVVFPALIASFKVDIIHLTSIFSHFSLILGFISALFNKKIIWSSRGELDEQALKYSPSRKKTILFLFKYYLSKKIYFHSTCDKETFYIKKIFNDKVKIIQLPNFIEMPDLISQDKKNPRYLLFIGRIHPIKALDNLIEALSLSQEFLHNDSILKIAGDYKNQYGERLQNLTLKLNLQNKVQFIGRLEGEEKERLYANAFFTILPSHTENFGNVIVESLAQGTPAIASTGTPWQILEEKKAGFWTDNSPEALASTIDKIFSLSPDEYAAYRLNAYALATEHFDVNKNIHRWIEAYKNVLNES